MKKVLTIAIVALLATATVFAGVNFGGKFTGGYVLNWHEDDNGDWDYYGYQYGTDGIATGDAALSLSVKDDNGFWSLGFDYVKEFGDGDANADFTLNLDKIIGAQMGTELPVTLALGVGINGRQSGLRAYSNNSGHNFDRIRTNPDIVNFERATDPKPTTASFVTLTVGYEDFFKVNGAVTPMKVDGDILAVVGALITPINGVAVSANYVYNGHIATGVKENIPAENLFSAAADINIGELIDADFSIGASVAYAFADTDDTLGDPTNQLAATVYGGIDLIDAYVEYAGMYIGDETTNFLEVGVNLNVVKDLALNAYFGMGDMEHADDTYYVGATVGYDLAGVGLELNVEYNEQGRFGYGDDSIKGFSITPSVSVSF